MPDSSPAAVAAAPPSHPAAAATHAPGAWLVLGLLTCAYSLSWMDRFLLVILIDPISRDLHVSNTEIGLLTGFGASLLYSLSGFPMGRLADRHRRTRLVACTLGGWSALTGMIGLAVSFPMLAAARFGMAVLSAGCSPSAYSLIADLFAPVRRGMAIALYSLGISFGTFAGLSLGGIVSDQLGWRQAFVWLSVPGLVLALLLGLVLREPARGRFDGNAHEAHRHYTLREAWQTLAAQPAFLAIAMGFGLLSCAASAFENWIPTWMIRAQHLSTTEVGALSGVAQGLVGIVASLGFGILADRLAARDRRWYVWIPVLTGGAVLPLVLLFFLLPRGAAYGCYMLIEFLISGCSAPLFAACQMLLPARLRAVGMATVLFLLNTVGMGVGPSLTGFLSDHLPAATPAAALGQAISLMQGVGVLGIVVLLAAARRIAPGAGTP
ncbi:MAG TPA: MFS transporter [Novosphingobium sp.]|nr:MFS transporter [Novosphingobium sp.]